MTLSNQHMSKTTSTSSDIWETMYKQMLAEYVPRWNMVTGSAQTMDIIFIMLRIFPPFRDSILSLDSSVDRSGSHWNPRRNS